MKKTGTKHIYGKGRAEREIERKRERERKKRPKKGRTHSERKREVWRVPLVQRHR